MRYIDNLTATPSKMLFRRTSDPLEKNSSILPAGPSLERSTSAPAAFSYYQSLLHTLKSPNPSSISIVSDNHATHAASSQQASSHARIPLLPTLDDYDPLDDFLPSLLKETGIATTSSYNFCIIDDNASANTRDCAKTIAVSSSKQKEETSTPSFESKDAEASHSSFEDAPSLKSKDAEASHSSFEDEIITSNVPSNLKIQRCSSLDRKPVSSRTFWDSFSTVEGDDIRACFSRRQYKSPLSVVDLFGVEDAEEIRSSFHSL